MTGPDEPEEPDDEAPPTLGARLDRLGQRMATRHRQQFAWQAGTGPVLERAAALSDSFTGRFDRTEPAAGPMPAARPAAARSVVRPDTPATGPARGAGAMPSGASPAPPQPHVPAGTGRPLPADVRSALRDVAGPGADAVRVHTDGVADGLARSRDADAVTVGTDVHLRAGRFAPDEPAGFALLGHETAHVTAALADGATHRSTPAGVQAEERAARAVEVAAAQAGPTVAAAQAGPAATAAPSAPHRSLASIGATVGGGAVPAGDAVAGTAAVAMNAAVDRDPSDGSGPSSSPAAVTAGGRSGAAAAPFDVEALRRQLIADLKRQLRSEFERGA